MIIQFFHFLLNLSLAIGASAASRLRTISASSCDVIRVNLALDVTTQIVLEQEPKATLFADKKHFKVINDATSPRSLAIIPIIETAELEAFRNSKGTLLTSAALASAMNENFKTNLFVFFDRGNQLMFELTFVKKEKADYILKVNQIFTKNCGL